MDNKTPIQYNYVKKRRQFGRPVKYFLTNEVLANYGPSKSEGKRFLTKWTMDKSTEKRTQFAVASVNTENAEYVSRGMCHREGGYAKDIDIDDEEQTLRYKKKLQRSEEYRIEMTKNLEYPATKVSISIEPSPKIAVAYSHSIHVSEEENVTCPLVWDITQNECFELNCESSCSALSYHKKYSNLIAGGLQNGEICLWDTRCATEPCVTPSTVHDGYVSCLRWSHKCNFEMLTGSSNGEVFWWDIRKMNDAPCQYRIDSVDADKRSSSRDSVDSTDLNSVRRNACTAVDFDKIHSKYIRVGSGDGRVIVTHRTSNKIEKMYEIKCHEEYVSTIAQSSASYKCILTVDSCDIKMWDEDMKTDPIFTVSSIENEYCCGVLSLTRYSRFFIGKVDGTIQFWDLTFDHHEPYFTLKPTCNRVNDIQTNVYGNLMASCHSNGDVYAIELTDYAAGVAGLKNWILEMKTKQKTNFFLILSDYVTR